MSTGLEYVKIERTDSVAVVTIDRQDKLNALNESVIRELGIAFDEVGADSNIRAVVLTGAGEKAFVAGADISDLATMDSMSGVAVSRAGQDVFSSIERLGKPVIAAVGGYALGGGCELALACHIRIASENARFGLPEVGLGILPGYGGTVRLARLIGFGRAVEMTVTAELIDAAKASEIGLVTSVCSRDELMGKAMGLAAKIAKNGPVAVRLALESIYLASDSPVQDALTFESSLFGLLASTEDMKEGMQAFLEKRKPDFKGR